MTPITPLDIEIDVSDAVALRGPLHTTVTVVAPPEPVEPAMVAFAFPGGGYNRRYFDLDLELEGPGGSSEARWHAARGWWFVACDHLGVGESSHPDPEALDFELLAAANDATVREVCARLEGGTLDRALPAARVGTRLGFGQSMGGCLTIVAQGRHQTFDGIGVLGYSAAHTVLPAPTDAVSTQPNIERGSSASIEATSAAIGDDTFRYAFHWDDVPNAVVERDLEMYPLRDHPRAPAWGQAATPPPCAVSMMSPAAVASEAAMIDVPVLIAVGERDVVPAPLAEPAAYPSATDVCVFVAPRMAHMHNFAGTRELLWRRSHAWGDRVAAITAASARTK